MSGVATAIAGAAVVGYIASESAADSAAEAQENASRRSQNTQEYMYDQTRADQQPWRQAGARALEGMEGSEFQQDFTMGDFQKDPGYQFRMKEGMKAIEGSASARGSLNSGATMKALTRYGQDFASNEYANAYNRYNSDKDRRFNRLSSLAGVGQTANSQVGQAGQNMANNVSANQTAMGNANAARAIASGNNMTSMANTMAGAYGTYAGSGS